MNVTMTGDALTREQMETQLDQIELLRAMFPSEDEIQFDAATESLLSELRRWCEGEEDHTSATMTGLPPFLSFTLTLKISIEMSKPREITLNLEVSLTQTQDMVEAPHVRMRILQPDWLTKAEVAQMNKDMPQDDALSAIDHVREEATAFIAKLERSLIAKETHSVAPLVRVWFYFPSISTREKRDDLVNNAPGYNLTGFLLAGKPGVLCLEGGVQDIDDYMKFIKTESWGDIQSSHKKVSERHRETGDGVTRAFAGMQEITNQLEKRGQRQNRSDMKALEMWLIDKGLGGAFDKVLL